MYSTQEDITIAEDKERINIYDQASNIILVRTCRNNTIQIQIRHSDTLIK